jgi:hypothetical protein
MVRATIQTPSLETFIRKRGREQTVSLRAIIKG